MLFTSKNSTETHLAKILDCTRAIAFLGTPHCGSNLVSWASTFNSLASLLKTSNVALLNVLQPESEVLARVQQEFHTMVHARSDAGKPPIRITYFFEDLPARAAGAVVPKHSTILPAYTSIAIHDNHMDMTKFPESESEGYQAVSNELWRWARDIGRAPSAQSALSPGTNAYGQPSNAFSPPLQQPTAFYSS